jgi:hypothetical protein
MNSTFQSNRDEPKSYEGDYSTDVLAQKAYGLLDEAVAAGKPFFLTAAPVAPHCDIQMNSTIQDPYHKFDFGPPVSAKRHEHLFMDEKVPRTKNFNPDEVCRENWWLPIGSLRRFYSPPCFTDFFLGEMHLLDWPDKLIFPAVWSELGSRSSKAKPNQC